MRTSRRQLASLCSALLLGQVRGAAPARAEEPAAAASHPEQAPLEVVPEAYTRAVNLGFEAYERQHYEAARAHFREAHAAFPNARSLRALGAVEYDLQSYVTAARLLEEALASTVRPLHASLRDDTEALLARARDHVGVYPVVLRPGDAVLSVDGQPPVRDARGALTLSLGEHTLSAAAPGYAALQQHLTVEPGTHEALALALVPLPASERAAASSPARTRWYWWTLAAALAGGAAAGIALGARSGDSRSEPSESNLPGVRSVNAQVSWP